MENLIKYEEIKKAYDDLTREEESIDKELSVLCEQRKNMDKKMSNVHSMLSDLQLIHNDSDQLSGMVSFTSTLADNVSSKVRELDLAKGRVISCIQRVEDIIDLKFCTDGVRQALADEDYEQASAHVHRFLSLDENVLRMSSDASESSTLDSSFKLLHECQDKLKTIVRNKFDAAVHQGDVASVERFFKIFPLIGEHEAGISRFSKYLSSQLSDTAEINLKLALDKNESDKRANVLYADTLTLLYEGIARIVEIHQPLVETYYGPGKMFTLMQYLQKECDRQSSLIIEEFKRSREFKKQLQLIEQALSISKGSNSDKLDPKNLDVLLQEITLLNTRTELYLRFVKRRIVTDMEIAEQTPEAKKEKLLVIEQFISSTQLSKNLQEIIGSYIMMEEYFMREMVVKAVAMDLIDESSNTSSMVDDTFFIIKKCVRRTMSSSSVDGVCAMLNHACTTLEQEFRNILYNRLRQGFPSGFDFSHAYNLVQSSIQQGKIQSSDTETQKAKTAFLVALNNVENSYTYIKTLQENLETEIDKLYGANSEQDQSKLKTCLSEFEAASKRFKEMTDFGFSQLNNNAIKPRLKPWVDSFLSTNHNLTEEDFSSFEANDPWVQNFIVNLDSMMSAFKSSLTLSNYDLFVNHISYEVTSQLEKSVLKTSFNRLGGLQYDKELRSLIGYLTSVTTWTIRDRFARLTQMATLLNMERVSEISDYWGSNSGPMTWRLTPTEVRQVLSLRVDFRSEEIKKLKL